MARRYAKQGKPAVPEPRRRYPRPNAEDCVDDDKERCVECFKELEQSKDGKRWRCPRCKRHGHYAVIEANGWRVRIVDGDGSK